MGTLIIRKEALGILGIIRNRCEALVEDNTVRRVGPLAWKRGLYRRDDVLEALALFDERAGEKRVRAR